MRVIQKQDKLIIHAEGTSGLIISVAALLLGALIAIKALIDGAIMPGLLGVVVVTMGVVITLITKRRTVSIQKDGPLTIATSSFLPKKVHAETHDIKNIQQVRLTTSNHLADSESQTDSPHLEELSVLSLVFADTSLIELGRYRTSGNSTMDRLFLMLTPDISEDGKRIAHFLNVPFAVVPKEEYPHNNTRPTPHQTVDSSPDKGRENADLSLPLQREIPSPPHAATQTASPVEEMPSAIAPTAKEQPTHQAQPSMLSLTAPESPSPAEVTSRPSPSPAKPFTSNADQRPSIQTPPRADRRPTIVPPRD